MERLSISKAMLAGFIATAIMTVLMYGGPMTETMMISCEELLRELSDYLDGEVTPGLRAAIEAHIRTCGRCSVLVDTTRRTLRIIANERVLSVPYGYSDRLHAYLEKHIGQ